MASLSLVTELAASDATISIATARVDQLSSALEDIAADLQGLGQNWMSERLRVQLYEVILSSVFAGLYTMLVLFAAYLLCRKGLKNTQLLIMLIIILTLYTSTTVYWATLLSETFHELRTVVNDLFYESARMDIVMSNFRQVVLESGTATIDSGFSSAVHSQLRSWWPRPTQECVGTATLTLNVVVGDAVVWWRALVLWKRCPFRRCAYSCLLVCVTLIPGAIVTTHGCRSSSSPLILTSSAGTAAITSGSFYIRDRWGLAASVLSLVANGIATGMIAYKAWQHRRLVHLSLGTGTPRSRVEKSLALLVESGSMYCLLWLMMVIYQACAITSSAPSFIYRFHFLVEGCLIPLIGIYPTVIILLVAMNRSQCEASLAGESCSNLQFTPDTHPSRIPHETTTMGTEASYSGEQCVFRLNTLRSPTTISWRPSDVGEEKTAEEKGNRVRSESESETGLDVP
ncbi:hypothetical protein C8Q80DRAFT_461006 [Daedaleopsis nitida]|nr:hypothetical protein C8Q80DRAFT_461006 [Daedaleopsis nitida]